MARLLVVYATKYGQTRKIAANLADGFTRLGHEVEAINAADAGTASVAEFDAVVVGGPVYRSTYPAELITWVTVNAQVLSGRPSAYSSVCLGILQRDDPATQQAERKIVTDFFAQTGWTPPLWAIFAGALPYTKYNWLIRLMMKRITAKAGGDTDTSRDYEYTDWNEVRRFAEGIDVVVNR